MNRFDISLIIKKIKKLKQELFWGKVLPYGNRPWNIRRIYVIRDVEYTLILRRK